MCSIDWNLLLEYLKVILNWPPVALILGVIFFYFFKVGINNFLGRVTEGSIFGNTFKASPQSTNSSDASIGQLTEQSQTNVIDESHLIEKLKQEEPDAEKVIAFVKANPAHTVIEYKKLLSSIQFEKCFNAIYGTQIALLDTCLARDGKVTYKDLIAFHNQHQKLSNTTTYPLNQYTQFLIDFNLISSKHDYSEITEIGKEFLVYIKTIYPLAWDKKSF